MTRLLGSCICVFVLALASGCYTSTSNFRSEIDAVAPKAEPGSIEAHVLGAPSEVRFYLNGKRQKRGLQGSTFRDTRLALDLPPGTYRLEARFRIGEFEGRKLECRVSCLEPLRVRAGEHVRLRADMRRDWSNPSEDRVSYFQSSAAATEVASEVSGHSTQEIPVAVNLPPHVSAEKYAGMRSEMSPSGTNSAGDGQRTPDAITIRGRDVLDDGQPAPVAGAESSSQVQIGAGGVEVSLQVESDPPGAQASVDGKALGNTPLRVTLDPRVDHVLQFDRDGCETKLQLLGTSEWQEGRSPRVVAKLDCR